MNIGVLFRFFVRFFLAFLAAKLLLLLLGADSPGTLLGLSLGLTLLTYIFDFLPPSEIGWFIARLLISLNLVRHRRRGQNPSED